jgi:hypothetical protein
LIFSFFCHECLSFTAPIHFAVSTPYAPDRKAERPISQVDGYGGHPPIIGAAGIYYRVLVGPVASAEKAAKLCSGLKAAGGDCVILRN